MRIEPINLSCFKVLFFFLLWSSFPHQIFSEEDSLESKGLPRGDPASENVDVNILADFIQSLDTKFEGIHSIMVLRNGKVISEGWWSPYQAEDKHMLFSLSKIFTSTAVGIAVQEERFSIDDLVVDFFPDDLPDKPSKNLQTMRVRDLLTMTTGHQKEPSLKASEMSVRSFFDTEIAHEPGTHFKYNTPATFIQSAIVQKVTGQKVVDYLRSRLFEPLGITDPFWRENFEGISLGGYGLRLRTEDIAKLGQLYLQKGKWGKKTIIKNGWVDMATSKQVSNGNNPNNDWSQGYGFQFWRCRFDSYRGDGLFGQFCIVLPKLDAVIAITSGENDMAGILNLVWDKFLPACLIDPNKKNNSNISPLKEILKRLKIDGVAGNATTESEEVFLNSRYSLGSNSLNLDALELNQDSHQDPIRVTLLGDDRKIEFSAGHNLWVRGRSDFPNGLVFDLKNEPLAASYGWEEGHTLNVKVCAIETPFNFTMKFKFTGDDVTLSWVPNVGFDNKFGPDLVGRKEK